MDKNDDRLIKKGSRVFKKKYIAEKKSKQAFRIKSKKPFIVFLILIFILGVLYNIITHPLIKIQDIYISGNTRVSDTEIIKKLSNPLGKNILTYNVSDKEDDLKDISYIEDAKIRKVFPKILSIKVSENYPMYIAKTSGKEVVVTNQGIIVNTSKDLDENKLTILKARIDETQEGKPFTTSEASIDFIRAISNSSFALDLSQLNLENKLDIGIMLKDIEVKFGDLNNISDKIKLLEKVLADINNKGLEVDSIDLKNKDKALVVVKENSFSEDLNN